MVKHEENHEVTLKFKHKYAMESAIGYLKQKGFDFEVSGISDYDFMIWKEDNNE